MRRTVHVEASGLTPGGWVLVPRPFDHWGQRFVRFAAEGVGDCAEIKAQNSACRAYLLRATGDVIRLRYEVDLGACSAAEWTAPDWVWRMQENRYTVAAESLVAHARDLTRGAEREEEALRRIIDDAAALFDYDHPDEKFNEGCDAVPTICGTSKGSCVDINTYILAAATAVGITGQYIAGYWFHPHKTETTDMHCWLAFEIDGRLAFWDLAHCLKWADTLGATICEGLNPAGGRRVAMSCGRGLAFETPVGPVSVSHFSEPVLLTPDRAQIRPQLLISVEEPEGCRTQLIDPPASGAIASTAAE